MSSQAISRAMEAPFMQTKTTTISNKRMWAGRILSGCLGLERLVLIDWKGDQVANGFGSWNLMSYPICRDLDGKTEFSNGVFCRAQIPVNLSTGGDYQAAEVEVKRCSRRGAHVLLLPIVMLGRGLFRIFGAMARLRARSTDSR
ncbi:MAG: hypothetical protein M3Y57_18230 [Acidobacteriota bacterium]|nr:hypothetical protein [Acidobacteriota bacterium]